MTFRKPQLIPVIAVTCTVALLLALGAWQLQRLAWKNAVVDQINAAQALPALGTLPDDPAALEKLAYRKVALVGHWIQDKPALHVVGHESGGYVWLLPFRLEDSDQVVLVTVGWHPIGVVPEPFPTTTMTIEGTLRPPRPKRLFSPDNFPQKNIWFTEDIPAMEKATGQRLLPMIVDTQKIPPLRNDHLGYAITWFLLAGICLGMFAYAHRE